jgi:hypothetical protein
VSLKLAWATQIDPLSHKKEKESQRYQRGPEEMEQKEKM